MGLLLFILICISAAIGYVLNLFKLFSPFEGVFMKLVRIFGIIFPLIGCIVGYFGEL